MKKHRICSILLLLSVFLLACDLPFSMPILEPAEMEVEEVEPKKPIAPKELEQAEEKPNHIIRFEGEFVPIPEEGYSYEYLTEPEQIWYHNIFSILAGMEEKKKLSEEPIKQGLTADNIDKIFQCVMIDHPEIFYVVGYEFSKYTLGEQLVSVEFSGKYTMDMQERDEKSKELYEKSKEFLKGISPKDSDYEKVKYLYETIILNTEYVLDAPESQNVYSVLVNHKSVCQGYAKTFQLLCLQLGIPCTLIVGLDNIGEGHAWNLVQIDGNYYLSDITWGDAYYKQEEDGNGREPEINYDYFLTTSKEFEGTHTEQMLVPIPKCVSTESNYFVQENTYYEIRDEEALEQVFYKAVATERNLVSIKFSTDDLYQEMREYLVENGNVFKLWPDVPGKLFFSGNEQVRTMTFWMTNE